MQRQFKPYYKILTSLYETLQKKSICFVLEFYVDIWDRILRNSKENGYTNVVYTISYLSFKSIYGIGYEIMLPRMERTNVMYTEKKRSHE